jgi:dihydroxyacetone kinase
MLRHDDARQPPVEHRKKLINDPFAVVDEALDGFVAAHHDIVRLAAHRVVARRAAPESRKVGVVIGGGSGHEPAFAGYVGLGMADAACCGNVFASPSADVVHAAIQVADRGRGVILAYGNYAGDVMNFGLARELAETTGIEVREIRVTDDVASAPAAEADRRRGIAGDILVFKCVGAAAERGDDLEEVLRIAARANEATRSIGVALSSCEVPGSGGPTFDLPADAIEIGMGVHGEPGIRRGPLEPADAIARTLVETIMAETGASSALEVALLVNGLGATATMEQYILYRAARQTLEDLGASVSRSYVGEFITSLEMAGASITVMVLDDELRALLDAPARTVALTR